MSYWLINFCAWEKDQLNPQGGKKKGYIHIYIYLLHLRVIWCNVKWFCHNLILGRWGEADTPSQVSADWLQTIVSWASLSLTPGCQVPALKWSYGKFVYVCVCECVWGKHGEIETGREGETRGVTVVHAQMWVCLHGELDSDGLRSDLKCEGRNMRVQRAALEDGERGSLPHGLVIRTSPHCCGCSGDRFLRCRGHIITFTHFCPVSTSAQVSSVMGGQHNHAGKWAHRVLAKYER